MNESTEIYDIKKNMTKLCAYFMGYITVLLVYCGMSNTIVLEIP